MKRRDEHIGMTDLFAQQAQTNRAARQEANLRHGWAIWGWPGPAVGGLCEIDIPIPLTPSGRGLYCYGEQARLVKQHPDGTWMARIEMGVVDGKPWSKDGRLVVLERYYIGPPRRRIRAARKATGDGNG